jgi:hypothetical protein
MRVALAVIMLLSVVSAIRLTWLAWHKPRRLLEINREIRRPDEVLEADPRIRDYATLGFALVGFGIFIYSGVYACLFWMPTGWGASDESGDWRPFRESLSALASVLAFPLFGFVAGAARLRMWEIERSTDRADT